MKVADLQKMLKELRGTHPVGLLSVTRPQLLQVSPDGKLNEFHDDCVKLSHIEGLIGFIYEPSVNAQRVKEGLKPNFEAMPRKWGGRLLPSPLVEYKGKYYLEVKVTHPIVEKYFTDQGEEIDSVYIKQFIPQRQNRQGLDKPVVLRDYSLENLKSIHFQLTDEKVAVG